MAVIAAVVRRQGIDLGDAAHGGHEAGTNAAAAAHQIAVGQGLAHQLLGDGIQGGKAVAYDGAQFLFQPFLDDLRQGIAVKLLSPAPGPALDVIRRVGPVGLEGVLALGVLGEQPQLFHLIGDELGIVNHDLMAFFRAQIGELIQHFLGGLEVQRRLIVAVLEAQTGLNDGAVDGVLRVQKVDVPPVEEILLAAAYLSLH